MREKSGGKSRFPDRGDIVIIDLKPVRGHEQGGNPRPVLVLSPYEYNVRSGLCLVVPFTSQKKGYPFEVDCEKYSMKTSGVVLADAIRNIDWRARNARFIEQADEDLISEVMSKLLTLLD